MLKIHRSTAVTAGIAAAAALVASGITYASASTSATRAPSVIAGGTGTAPVATDPGSASKGNEGVAVIAGGTVQGRQPEHRENREHREHREHHEEGRIQINERSYSSHPGECVVVALVGTAGRIANSLNIFNDSDRTVDVFKGPVCDNGAPIAHVERDSTAYNVNPDDCCEPNTGGNVCLASFRVVHERDHHDDHDDRDDRGDRGDRGDDH
ncbi:hypothetical protein ACIHEJ_14870 [Streptomyces sp. NPDC052301]|uniref:hypothetical protein n=1 Tax=Streptomyces sp. NPDC052301 TaxID=3365687 RepID=UPI0037D26849